MPSTAEAAPTDADLFVRALGPTEIWSRGTKVERWASRRGLAILRFLLIKHPAPVHREQLMTLLWPHSSNRAARNNLNVAIHGLRRALEVGGPGPYVVFDDGAYRLADSLRLWLDVEQFTAERANIKSARGRPDGGDIEPSLTRLLTLYRGELFADDQQSDWLLPLRRRYQDQFVDHLEQAAELALTDHDLPACIERGEQILAVDPCRESVHRLLMRAHVARGHHHLAARQYAECVATLQDRLDVAPRPETTDAFLDLLDQRR